MDVQAKLGELRAAIEHARSMPMSASAVVNRGQLLALVEELETGLGDVGTGRSRAEVIVAEAQAERDRIISETDVHQDAQREAEALLARAREEADALRAETDDYVDAKLANFEITLERTSEAVRRGRARLAGRSDFEDIGGSSEDAVEPPRD